MRRLAVAVPRRRARLDRRQAPQGPPAPLPRAVALRFAHPRLRKMSSKIHSEDSDRRESRVMTTSTNSVLIGGAGPGAPMAPAVAVKPMSVDEKNRAIRARAVAEAKK